MALGYAASTHRKARKGAQKMAYAHAKAARTAAQKGQCRKALMELTHTYAWSGVTIAEHLDSGPKRGKMPTKAFASGVRKVVLARCGCSKKR